MDAEATWRSAPPVQTLVPLPSSTGPLLMGRHVIVARSSCAPGENKLAGQLADEHHICAVGATTAAPVQTSCVIPDGAASDGGTVFQVLVVGSRVKKSMPQLPVPDVELSFVKVP